MLTCPEIDPHPLPLKQPLLLRAEKLNISDKTARKHCEEIVAGVGLQRAAFGNTKVSPGPHLCRQAVVLPVFDPALFTSALDHVNGRSFCAASMATFLQTACRN